MSRKSSRLASAVEEEVPRQALTKLTRVYKRPKKDDITSSGKENTSNNIPKVVELANKKKEEVKKKDEEPKRDNETKKVAKKNREEQKKAQKNDELAAKQDAHVSDYLKIQQEYFKSVDDFELTVVEQPPSDWLPSVSPSHLPPLPTKSTKSPLLKDLIEQEFKKQEERYTQKATRQPPRRKDSDDFDNFEDAGADIFDDLMSDTTMGLDIESDSEVLEREQARARDRQRERERERAREKEREKLEAEGVDLFGYDDYENLVDELDAELSYLNAPKVPLKPIPAALPVIRAVDPTESDFFPPTPAVAPTPSRSFIPPTPAATIPPTPSSVISIATPSSVLPPSIPQRSPGFAYQEYKIVVGLVGSPMSFEEFMARQKR